MDTNRSIRNAKPQLMQSPECQLHSLQNISEPMKMIEIAWQFRSRLTRFAKRRLNYLRNWWSRMAVKSKKPVEKPINMSLRAGDFIRIKTKEEIRATLDSWNRLNGCTFLEEMWTFCGTNQRVMKKLERFLDERDYRVKTSKGIVLLEGVICPGTVDFGKCDRSCFFFWREEWLEKLD